MHDEKALKVPWEFFLFIPLAVLDELVNTLHRYSPLPI